MAHADAGLGAMAWLAGDHDYALELFKSVLEGFSIYEEPANNLFEMKTMIQSNPTTAELQRVVEQNRDRATVVNEKAGAKAALGEYLYHMGKTAHRQGQFEQAETALVESLVLCDSAEDMRGVAIAVAALAVGAHARGATCWLHVWAGRLGGEQAPGRHLASAGGARLRRPGGGHSGQHRQPGFRPCHRGR